MPGQTPPRRLRQLGNKAQPATPPVAPTKPKKPWGNLQDAPPPSSTNSYTSPGNPPPPSTNPPRRPGNKKAAPKKLLGVKVLSRTPRGPSPSPSSGASSTRPGNSNRVWSPYGSDVSTAPSEPWNNAPEIDSDFTHSDPEVEKKVNNYQLLISQSVEPNGDLVVMGFGKQHAAEAFSKRLKLNQWAMKHWRVLVAREMLSLVSCSYPSSSVYYDQASPTFVRC